MSDEPLQRTGRGGAGNFRRPSNDPANADAEKGIIKNIKDSASSIFSSDKEKDPNKVEYVHHGRGGAGNLSTTSNVVKPVQSVFAPKTEVKPARGRGGAGNIESASAERASLDATRHGNVVSLPSEEAEKAGKNVAEPQAAHLGGGREIVHEGRDV